MADIYLLPTAAATPVVNHRRRGSYGRKVTSLNSRRKGRSGREDMPDARALASTIDMDREALDLEETALDIADLVRTGQLQGLAFVVEREDGRCQAGVIGSLKGKFSLANTVWLKLHAAMFMAGRLGD
jgi:hypothetical protein